MINKEDLKSFFLITVPTIVIFLVILEALLNWLAPVSDPFERYKKINFIEKPYIQSQFQKNAHFTFEIEKGLPHMDQKVHFTTNNYGFRGDELIEPKPADEFRIFLIGGSTTENIFIDDQYGLERQIQNELQTAFSTYQKTIKVYNAGKSGDASPDHISMLVHRIIHLQPDLVILYPGINDLNRLLGKYDYLHYPVTQKGAENSILKDFKFFLSNFQIFRRIINILNPENPDDLESIFLKTNYADKIKSVQKLPLKEQIPNFDSSFYYRNITTFIGACKTNSIPLVLINQAHTWGDDADDYLKNHHWMNSVGKTRYPENEMEKSIHEINQITENLSKENNIPFINFEASIPKSSEYFYDDCHFNKNGVKFAAELISQSIQPLISNQ